jgi:hypothetical protein
MCGAVTGVAGRITIERDKKTWEPLLTTPMTGREILASKMRVIARSVWDAGRWLLPLWLLGIVCGALHPIGVVAAAAGLVLGTWLALAHGSRLAVRPGATTPTANSSAALWSMALMIVGGLTIIAPLTSGRELAAMSAYDPRLPWLAAAVLAATLLATAALARRITRGCFDRFDEWVGRPHRAAMAGPGGGEPAAAGRGPVGPVAAVQTPGGPGDQAILGRESQPASSGSTSR